MNVTVSRDIFEVQLRKFAPDENATERALGMYSAAVALADDGLMTQCLGMGDRHAVTREMFYEVVLQSYLFLGFPRMLTAAECFDQVFPSQSNGNAPVRVSHEESLRWYEDGLNLCRRVYGDKYESLLQRVSAMAPEVLRWMIVEGYGKVLSRPTLDIVRREISIIAFLVMENRVKQLRSHMQGALNVGAPGRLILSVVNDIGPAAGDGFESAVDIARKLGMQ